MEDAIKEASIYAECQVVNILLINFIYTRARVCVYVFTRAACVAHNRISNEKRYSSKNKLDAIRYTASLDNTTCT